MPRARTAGEAPPSDDTIALRALTTACVLDTLPEERFDRITRLACHTLCAPMAVVMLVDRERRWLKSGQGLGDVAQEDWLSLCDSRSFHARSAQTVPDTLFDGRTALHPLVQGAPRVRFLANQNLVGPDGSSIGCLAVMDRVPRTLSREDAGVLMDLGAMVEREISLIETATTDDLTRLSNRRGFVQAVEHALAACRHSRQPATVVSLDLDNFKLVNDHHGHAAGDEVLRRFAKLLVSRFTGSGAVGRLGGDEFAVLCCGHSSRGVAAALAELRAAYDASTLPARYPALSWSVGLAEFSPDSPEQVEELLHRADLGMYAAKAEGRTGGLARTLPAEPVRIMAVPAAAHGRLRRMIDRARAAIGRPRG